MAIITGGITSTYIRNFEREFKRAYGEKVAALQTFIDFRSGRVGEDDRFGLSGKVHAHDDILGVRTQLESKQYKTLVVPTVNREVAVPIYWQTEKKTNFDQASDNAESVADAVTRDITQAVIDAMNAGYDSVDHYWNLNTQVLSGAVLKELAGAMNMAGIPMRDRHIVASAESLMNLMDDSEFVSILTAMNKPLTDGAIDGAKWLGFTLHELPAMEEGGMPAGTSAGTSRFFAFHKAAIVGFENEGSRRVEVYEDKPNKCNVHRALFDRGIGVLDTEGLFAVDVKVAA